MLYIIKETRYFKRGTLTQSAFLRIGLKIYNMLLLDIEQILIFKKILFIWIPKDRNI